MLVGAFVCIPVVALAQVPSSEEPGRQNQRFVQQTQPKSKPGATIVLPSTIAPSGAAAIVLHVTSVRIVGSSVYSATDLAPLYSSIAGKDVTLAAVYELAQKVAAKYGNDGYVLSRAIIPPQNLDPKGAVVTIKVIEGYVDEVQWPTTLKHQQAFFNDYTAKITGERPTNIKTVMRYLLLAGDLPGLKVSSRFQASKENENASTLVVDATEKPVDAWAQIDNRGTEARGPWEVDAGATFNDLLGLNEAVTATYAAALPTDELQYLSLGYKQTLTSEGLQVFADASYSWGTPGTAALQALDFKSQSYLADIGLSDAVIRSRDKNLTLAGMVFLSNNEGDLLGASSSDDKLRGVRLKADFDATDSSGGTTQINATLSHGFEGFGSTSNGNTLASRANGRVDFTTLAGTIKRVQPLGQGFSIMGAAQGQYAFTPLLSPEECGYGGKDIGRAFDPSEITGDSCWSVISEVRFDPSLPKTLLTQTQFYGFADYGRVYRIAPSAGTPSQNDGASVGVGIRLGTEKFNTDLSAAKPLFGRTDDGWRYFLTAGAKY